MPQQFHLSAVMAPPLQAPSPFACSVRRTGEQEAWVHVSGEIDLCVAAEFEHGLRSALGRAPHVVVDLRDVTFMETSGVHVLTTASDDARRDGHRVTVLIGSAPIERLLVLTGAGAHLDVADLRAGHTLEAHTTHRADWPAIA